MSRRLFTPTFIALLLVYAAVAILALTSAEWYKSAMTPSGPVRVGVLDYYPPFSFRDGSARRGFDVDIAGAICLRMNRPCEFVPLSFVDLIPALQDGASTRSLRASTTPPAATGAPPSPRPTTVRAASSSQSTPG